VHGWIDRRQNVDVVGKYQFYSYSGVARVSAAITTAIRRCSEASLCVCMTVCDGPVVCSSGQNFDICLCRASAPLKLCVSYRRGVAGSRRWWLSIPAFRCQYTAWHHKSADVGAIWCINYIQLSTRSGCVTTLTGRRELRVACTSPCN